MQLKLVRVQRILLVGILLLFSGLSLAQEAPAALNPDVAQSGTLNSNNVADVYRFEGVANGILSISASSSDTAFGVLVADASGNLISEATSSGDGDILIENIILAQTGSYLLTVFSSSTEEGQYTVTISLAIGDSGIEIDPQQTAPGGQFVSELADNTDVLLNNGMEVRLQWAASVDLNMEVRDPNGNTLYYDSRVSPNGGSFGFDANGLCELISDAPVETANWQPGFLPSGSYEILVFYRQNCEQSSLAVPFSLTVTVNGEVLPVIDASIAPSANPNSDSVYLTNFVVQDDGSASVNQGGAYPDSALNNLPASVGELQASAVPISRDVPVSGAIFEAQDYVVYSFEAQSNEIITASMTATSRNLDTLLQLVEIGRAHV